MKKVALRIVDKVVWRFAQTHPLKKPRIDSFDVMQVAFLKAAYESAQFYEDHLLTAPIFETDLDLLTHAMTMTKPGLCLEFGVASGRTISHIAGLTERVYGFDSFEGLPEDWRSGFVKGAFAGDLPPVPPNAVLIKGWFEKTLPEFLGKQQGPVAFLHIDCDLYSSTKTIFDLLAPRIVRGTVIVFDEYFNYPGWQQHEHKAFEEFKSAGIVCKPIGFVPSHQQVGFIVTKL
jgi:hypothetical protein